MEKFAELSLEDLAALAVEKQAAFDAIAALDTPSADQLSEAEAFADEIDEIATETAERTAAAEKDAADLAERTAALKTRFAAEDPEAEEVPEVEEVEEEVVEPEAEAEPEAEVAAAVETPAPSVAALATKVPRPATPKAVKKMISLTAAADVPQFATGAPLADLEEVGKALVNRMKGFGTPSGDGKTEQLQHFGVASIRLDFDDDLIIDRNTDDMEVLARAASEKRLEGGSLTAAGGWCAPSETIYDLCVTETLDGILSVPEVQINRGGIKYTSGPDFAAIYAAVGFLQTEAQAIAGTTKACYEVPCPAFTDVRLDAIGLCIKAPILTNAAYPELVQRWLSGSMIAHQHKVNASVIGRMVTAAGAARVITGQGSITSDTLAGLELLADQLRNKYRMGLTETMEVVVPFWVRGAIREDLSLRLGVGAEVITDQVIDAHFSARHLKVSFVYDWQDAGTTEEVYPATYQALMYPAGTFVKGVSDVINLNAVYDAASLAVNTYTALFFEQGLLVAKMCNEATLLTLPICTAGRTGAGDITCA